MNNQPLNNDDLYNILKYGIFYFPASKHYENNSIVICDMCKKNNLICSIGYNNYDLCLLCAEKISNFINLSNNECMLTKNINNNINYNYIINNNNKIPNATLMQQSIFNTFMMQEIFNKTPDNALLNKLKPLIPNNNNCNNTPDHALLNQYNPLIPNNNYNNSNNINNGKE